MLKIGSTVNYKMSKNKILSGIVTQLIPPVGDASNYDHGCIEVWLKNKTNHGCNNCEHFSYIGYEEFLKHIKDPIVEGELYVGKLLKTKYGKGLIVNLNMSDIYVFLYDEPNNGYSEEEEINIEELLNRPPPLHKSDNNFNANNYCLELTIKNLNDYLVT
jgi:hypothetical protein